MSFPGAVADRSAASYVLVGAPLDATTTHEPGARFGPRRMREAAAAFEDYDRHTQRRFSSLGVHDHGDVEPPADVGEYLTFLTGVLEDVRAGSAIPVVLGGEHTVTVAGLRATEPDVVVCLDAHLDLRESYANTRLSHATVCHHARGLADRVVILGARSGSEAEWDRAAAPDVSVVPPAAVPDWEPDFGDDRVYLSVDIDVVDPGYAPGTGTKAPFGLDPATVHRVVRECAPAMVGCDVVEVSDRDDGQTATLGAKLCRAMIYAHASR